MSDRDETCVYTANGEFDAQQVRAYLEANGISTELRGEALRNTHGLTLNGLGEVRIHVPVNDLVLAKELLRQAEAGETMSNEEAQKRIFG